MEVNMDTIKDKPSTSVSCACGCGLEVGVDGLGTALFVSSEGVKIFFATPDCKRSWEKKNNKAE
jgi:hypothetical protein